MWAVGDLAAVQAVPLLEPTYEIIEDDILAQGSLPSSGGAFALYRKLLERSEPVGSATAMPPFLRSMVAASPGGGGGFATVTAGTGSAGAAAGAATAARDGGAALSESWEMHDAMAAAAAAMRRQRSGTRGVVEFFKAWDEWGALSNFSPHPIDMPRGQADHPAADAAPALQCRWASVEHFYQAQKFMHADGAVAAAVRERSEAVIDKIVAAPSPEEAARCGRFHERVDAELVRADWAESKVAVMEAAVLEKFRRHAGPRAMLLSTAEEEVHLVEASPNDYFWGAGRTGTGRNMLGAVLQRVRARVLAEERGCSALRGEPLEHAV